MGLLDRAGARLTARPEEAEILVVNTCSFIDTAKQESVDTILEMARHKTEGRARKLIVAGCLVERYRDEIQKNIPEVDAVVGTGELESILEAAGIAPSLAAAPSPFNIITSTAADIRSGRESGAGTHKSALQAVTSRHPRATIASARADSAATTGRAHRTCCLPTSTTKPPRACYRRRAPRLTSKSPRAATTPAASASFPTCAANSARADLNPSSLKPQQLVARGVQEITLIGQDTTCYGEDLGTQGWPGNPARPLARIEGLRWLRFLYAYPNRITGKLLETIAQARQHLQISRSATPARLFRRPQAHEARRIGADIFFKTFDKVRAAVPGIALRTSFIVGFPGESSSDFEVLEEFIKEAKFDWLGVFNYSHEEGSAAYTLDSQLPKRTIESRRKRLMKLQQSISRRAKKNWVGRELTLLAEGPSTETPLLWEARTEFHAPEIDGKVFINDFGPLDDLEAGRFYRAEITESHDYDLVARILAPTS